ncbi:TRAP transporter large permease subunit [Candidatus Fermentibacteria bacterium]|nr:TRAP transporter large permease subunit [Candidatus Fermentibacteria bacterium]
MTGILALLALLGTPLFAVLAGFALLGFHGQEIPGTAVIIEMARMAGTSTLTPIPLFALAGYVMASGSGPQRLVAFSQTLLGWMPGGLGLACLAASALFTALTGASGVTIIALGGLLLPALLSAGYHERFSLGLVTTSGSLGLLFPPSLPLIIYAFIAEVPVDDLFRAGLLPGSLLVVVLALYSGLVARRHGVTRTRFNVAALAGAFRHAVGELVLPVVVIAGIYGGFLTVPEAAAFAAGYAILLAVVIRRELSPRALVGVIRESMLLVGGILVILCAALGLTSYLVDIQLPMNILAAMEGHVTSKLMFLLLLNLLLLAVGCLMDIFSALVVVVPLVLPLAIQFGVNPIHLGIIFLTNLEIGYSTPPVGLNLFVSSFRFRKPVVSLYLASLPFLAILLAALALITYWPTLSLALVKG